MNNIDDNYDEQIPPYTERPALAKHIQRNFGYINSVKKITSRAKTDNGAVCVNCYMKYKQTSWHYRKYCIDCSGIYDERTFRAKMVKLKGKNYWNETT